MTDKRVEDLEKELDDLRKEFRGYVEKKRHEESQRMRTALMAAGGIIMILGTFIWTEVIWPVIRLGLEK